MTTQFTETKTVCDCCGTELHKRNVYTNGGKYQADYVSKMRADDSTIDICFICAGKMFDVFVVKNTSDEKLQKWVDEFPKKMDPLNPMIGVELKLDIPGFSK